MYKKIKKIAAPLALALIFSSCGSLKQPRAVFTPPDYTAEDAVENEKRRIAKLEQTLPVKALWRASLLGDAQTLALYQSKLFERLQKAVEEKKYSDAFKYYKSLENTGFKDFSALPVTFREISDNFVKDVPGFAVNPRLLPKTVAECVDATVTIWVDKGIKFENGAGYADRVIGSGFFIDERGYIVTNHHVIADLVNPKRKGYSRLFIKLARDDETRIPAKVIGFDERLDIALIKAEVDPPFILELGSGSGLSIGDKISAIGTPLGLHGTITSGIVSNVSRKLTSGGAVFQIDTPINSGNSGGPCIDSKFRVQAIAFAGIQQYQGLNFAIPIVYLRQDLPFLYSGGKRSHVWLGAFGHTKKEGFKDAGIEVQYVMPGGTANMNGIEAGDVIAFTDGWEISSIEDLQAVFRSAAPETIVSCTYLREGEKKNALVYLDERPENPGYEIYKSDLLSHTFVPIFGMELTPSSTVYSRKYTITNILNGSVADESGFSVTDPVYIADVDFVEENSVILVSVSTRKKKKGYLDITMRIGNRLDNHFYF
ncbi:MAG: S1C family serine protease [Treponema sp.]